MELENIDGQELAANCVRGVLAKFNLGKGWVRQTRCDMAIVLEQDAINDLVTMEAAAAIENNCGRSVSILPVSQLSPAEQKAMFELAVRV